MEPTTNSPPAPAAPPASAPLLTPSIEAVPRTTSGSVAERQWTREQSTPQWCGDGLTVSKRRVETAGTAVLRDRAGAVNWQLLLLVVVRVGMTPPRAVRELN